MRSFYFGAWVVGKGHMLFEREGVEASRLLRNHLPWTMEELDCGLCPPKSVLPRQVPGKAGLHFRKDRQEKPAMWTALAFWDRSEDTRHNSNSVFLFEGVHSFDRMYELAEKRYPNVVCRIPVELELVWMPKCPKCESEWIKRPTTVSMLCPFCVAFRNAECKRDGGNGTMTVMANDWVEAQEDQD